MKKLILASVSVLALFGITACSDSADTTTTQSVPSVEQPAPATPAPADPTVKVPPATDNTTTQSIDPTPETGTGGEMQSPDAGTQPATPLPAEPAPAQ